MRVRPRGRRRSVDRGTCRLAIEPRNHVMETFWGADAVGTCGRQYGQPRQGERLGDPTRSETPCMQENTSRGSREIPRLASECAPEVRPVNPKGARPWMYGRGKSDSFVVPEKPSNNDDGAPPPAERVEERRLAKRSQDQRPSTRTQSPGMRCNTSWTWHGGGLMPSGELHPSQSTSTRYYLRQEPGAVVPLAGICTGGAGQPATLP